MTYSAFRTHNIYILALESASPANRHCANCIGTLSFPILAELSEEVVGDASTPLLYAGGSDGPSSHNLRRRVKFASSPTAAGRDVTICSACAAATRPSNRDQGHLVTYAFKRLSV